ncbi:MAG TPA: hypothetical protein VN303_01555 [Pseudomonas sp.]|nr:hypothetical protein [Pseudomonas sp.]
MRSTKASAAVERLKRRTGNPLYSMSSRSDGLFTLYQASTTGQSEPVGTALPMDEFVRFVNELHPPTPKRVSKLDVAFMDKLKASGAAKDNHNT